MLQDFSVAHLRRRSSVTRTAALLVAALVITLTTILVIRLTDGDSTSGGPPPVSPTAVARADAPTGPLAVPGDDSRSALPQATGFASGVTGGESGRVYHVTSGADSVSAPAPGSLRYGLSTGRPVWIVFDSDVEIRLAGALRVPSDTTIDGRGHRVYLTGHGNPGLQIYGVSNVVITHVTLRDFGDIARTEVNDPDDAIDVARSRGVWIDHCSLSVAGDKLIAVEEGAENITVSWNHFFDQEQTLQIGAQYSGDADRRSTVTVDHNWFDGVGYRTPLVDYAKAHVYNNVMDKWTVSAIQAIRGAQVVLQSNVFVVGPSRKVSILRPPQRCNDKRTRCDGREGFLLSVDNLVVGRGKLQQTGSADVFDPQVAYDYRAEPASAALAAGVRSRSGP